MLALLSRFGATLGLVVLGSLALATRSVPANATYIVTLEQVGSNVLGTGSGSLDFTALPFRNLFANGQAGLNPSRPSLALGPTSPTTGDIAIGVISGPATFGSGGGAFPINAETGTGPFVGLDDFSQELLFPHGYASGSPLGISTDTWFNASFASLGVTPGTYTWTWGSGDHADSFILEIGVASIPEPASLVLFGSALASFGVIRRRREFRRRNCEFTA